MREPVFYVAFGDSLTQGIGASAEECCFPYQYFQSMNSHPDCRYVNLGRSGMNSAELRQYVGRPDIRKLWKKATDMTITIGGNDLIRTYKKNGNIIQFFMAIQKLKWNIQRILKDILLHNPQVHVLIMGLYNPGLPDHPLYHRCNRLVRWVNSVYAYVSGQYNADFIDPYRHFLHRPHLLADEIHPNDEGYRVISRLFTQRKQSYLQKSLSKQPVFQP